MAKEPTVFNFGEDTQLREAPDGRLYIEDRDGNPKTIDSLSTEEQDNVFYASAHDGADGWEQIQAAIDAANNTSGDNAVIVGPLGPDTGGKWIGNTAIDIHSNTTLILRGAYIQQEADSSTRVFRNSDQTNGNEDITIVSQGATVDGNAPDSTRRENLTALTIDFYKVSDISINGSLTIKDTSAWGIKFEECNNPTVEHLHFDQNGSIGNQDGVKCIASPNVSIGRITGTTEDDPFSTNTDDARKFMHGTGGSYENVTVGKLQVTGGNNRLLIAKTDHDLAGYTAKDVTVGEVHIEGDGQNTAIKFGGDNDSAEFSDITIGEVHCDNVDFAVLFQEIGVENVEFGSLNCDVSRYAMQVSDGITVNNVSVKGGHLRSTTGNDGCFRVESGSAINDWTFDKVHCEGFPFLFDFLGSASGCYGDNIHATNIDKLYDRATGITFGPNVPSTTTGTFTHAGGSGETVHTATGEKFPLVDDGVEYNVSVSPDPDASDFSGDHGWYLDRVVQTWDSTNSLIVPKIAVNWETDPGSGNDLVLEYDVRPSTIR